ncbi:MAG: uroporphyrinogen-III synthase, partial [Alphaproteobacteria bacterium]
MSAARRPCVIVTRPRPDAEALIKALEERGIDTVAAPLLDILPEDGPAPDLGGVQALLFTSANGVRAFAARSAIRIHPVLAVGDATAAAARAAGFADVKSAGGNVDDLARLAIRQFDPNSGDLLHVAGTDVAGDLAGALSAAGFSMRRAVLYSARAAATLPEPAALALRTGRADAILFFSPRTAGSFVTLARDAGLGDACRRLGAVCLSDAVAAAAQGLPWREVAVAEAPTQAALLAALDDCLHRAEAAVTDPKPTDPQEQAPESAGLDAAFVIERFGGIRPMAAKLGVPVTTVQGWKLRGHLPAARETEIRATAERLGIDLTPPAAAEAIVVDSAGTAAGPSAGEAAASPSPSADPTPGPATAPAQASATPGHRAAIAVSVLALVAAAAAVAIVAVRPFDRPSPTASDGNAVAALESRIAALEQRPASEQPATGPLAERIAALEQRTPAAPAEDMTARLDALAQRVEAVETAPSGATADPPAGLAQELAAARDDLLARLAPLTERIDALQKQFAALMETVEQEQGQNLVNRIRELAVRLDDTDTELVTLLREYEAVKDRLMGLESRPVRTGDPAAALALAIGQLQTAVRDGQPYRAALDRVQTLGQSKPALIEALAALAAHADGGVARMDALQRDFDRLAPQFATAGTETADGGWFDQVKAKLASLVTIRRVGSPAESTGTPVERAGAALDAGDLPGALAALADLPRDRLDPEAATWLAAAEARVAALAALDRLNDL